MYETFIDLDELIGLCRDKQAKKLIQEAVACYRAGAFRSCIVATWNAVVFDFLHKLKELQLLGSDDASSLLQKFEKFRETENVQELWKIESTIPQVARKQFELISPVEQTDIERLLKDRSRCAHPSMISLEEPFEATAELARYHLRSAVIHLLQRPPVQGRSAIDQIWSVIKSEHFPPDIENAIIVIQKSPLARARLSVIKEIIIGLTISLLKESRSEDERKRQFSALNAIAKLNSKEVGEILNDKLSYLIENKIDDANWDKVIIYLGSITAWESISQSCEIKAKSFIKKLDIYEGSVPTNKRLSHRSINLLVKASRVDFLKNVVINKFKQINLIDLISVRNISQDNLFNQNVINRVLENMIPKALLSQLISMRSDHDETLNQLIEPYLKEKIEESFLDDLICLIAKYNNEYLNQLIETLIKPNLKERVEEVRLEELLSPLLKYNNEYLNQLVEPFIKEKIISSPWEDLILIKNTFKHEFIKPEKPLIELINNRIDEVINKVRFKDLHELIIRIRPKYSDPLVDNIKPLLKENSLDVIDIFIESSSWPKAHFNANLLTEISDILTPENWQRILDAFCTNDQIYGCPYSPYIASIFISLFQDSVKNSGIVQSYWLDFRKNLDKLTGGKEIDQLKLAIDLTQY